MGYTKSLEQIVRKKGRPKRKKEFKDYDLASELIYFWSLSIDNEVVSLDAYSEKSMERRQP